MIMDKIKNEYKVTFSYQGHTVTVDLRRIVAINHPNECDKFFRVYFENAIWNVATDQHDRLYKAWMGVETRF